MKAITDPDELGIFAANDDIAYVSSLDVAKAFDKQHKNVLAAIDRLAGPDGGHSDEFIAANMVRTSYEDSNHRQRRAYELTRDGFFMVTFGFTGSKAAAVKESYISRFGSLGQQTFPKSTEQQLVVSQQKKPCKAVRKSDIMISRDDMGLYVDDTETVRVYSQDVARMFKKEHKNVLVAIDNLVRPESGFSVVFRESNFAAVFGRNANGCMQRAYTMTRDGFCVLAFGFTGSKAAPIQEAYLARFDTVNKQLTDLLRDKYVINAYERSTRPRVQPETKDIYVIRNDVNNLAYVGQSVDPEKRFRDHKNQSQVHGQVGTLEHAMRSYGAEHFWYEVLEEAVKNYDEREAYWISRLGTLYPSGYNFTTGGAAKSAQYTMSTPRSRRTRTVVETMKAL